ncbi:MAG TPA: hypothetical protein ENK22_07340 [Persephonella sp.]|nr:hypothetical protein [Persephonella sp.]
MHISKIYGKGLYNKKAKNISKGKDIFASIFESMGKSDNKKRSPQKTSADKNLFQTTPSSIHLNLKENKVSKKQKEEEVQSPEENFLDRQQEDLSFGEESVDSKETVENNLKREENKKINTGSGKNRIKNPEVQHNFHYNEAFLREDSNRKLNSGYSLIQPELVQSGATTRKISKPKTTIQAKGKSSVVYEHLRESTHAANFSTLEKKITVLEKKTENISEKIIQDKNNSIFEGTIKEVSAVEQHSEKIRQNSDAAFVKQEKVSAGIPLYSFFSPEKEKTPVNNLLDKKNSRINNLINTEHSHKGKTKKNQKGTEHINAPYPEQIKEEPSVRKKEVDAGHIADIPAKNNKLESKLFQQPTDKVNFRPDGIGKNQDVTAFKKEKPKPSKDQPLEKSFNQENLEDLKPHKRSVKERLTNSSKITAFGRQNENKKTLEKNLEESQQSDRSHMEKPDQNFILSSSSEKLDLKAEKQPKSEINQNTSIQNVSNQKFSESSQDFSGKQHNQQAQTDQPLEDSSQNFDSSFNRSLILNLKLGDINLTARYIRNKMDLFLVMHSTTNQSLHSIRDEISHIIQDSGIEEYFVKIKTRDKELNYSSEAKKSDKKNTGLYREINVKV